MLALARTPALLLARWSLLAMAVLLLAACGDSQSDSDEPRGEVHPPIGSLAVKIPNLSTEPGPVDPDPAWLLRADGELMRVDAAPEAILLAPNTDGSILAAVLAVEGADGSPETGAEFVLFDFDADEEHRPGLDLVFHEVQVLAWSPAQTHVAVISTTHVDIVDIATNEVETHTMPIGPIPFPPLADWRNEGLFILGGSQAFALDETGLLWSTPLHWAVEPPAVANHHSQAAIIDSTNPERLLLTAPGIAPDNGPGCIALDATTGAIERAPDCEIPALSCPFAFPPPEGKANYNETQLSAGTSPGCLVRYVVAGEDDDVTSNLHIEIHANGELAATMIFPVPTGAYIPFGAIITGYSPLLPSE